jgi:hypothetical protein
MGVESLPNVRPRRRVYSLGRESEMSARSARTLFDEDERWGVRVEWSTRAATEEEHFYQKAQQKLNGDARLYKR